MGKNDPYPARWLAERIVSKRLDIQYDPDSGRHIAHVMFGGVFDTPELGRQFQKNLEELVEKTVERAVEAQEAR
jgi:hypothetical protein